MVIILMSTNGLWGNSKRKLHQIKMVQVQAGGQWSIAISLLALSGKRHENFGYGDHVSPLMLCVPKYWAEPISQSHSWNIPRDLSSQLVWVFSMFWTLQGNRCKEMVKDVLTMLDYFLALCRPSSLRQLKAHLTHQGPTPHPCPVKHGRRPCASRPARDTAQ